MMKAASQRWERKQLAGGADWRGSRSVVVGWGCGRVGGKVSGADSLNKMTGFTKCPPLPAALPYNKPLGALSDSEEAPTSAFIFTWHG